MDYDFASFNLLKRHLNDSAIKSASEWGKKFFEYDKEFYKDSFASRKFSLIDIDRALCGAFTEAVSKGEKGCQKIDAAVYHLLDNNTILTYHVLPKRGTRNIIFLGKLLGNIASDLFSEMKEKTVFNFSQPSPMSVSYRWDVAKTEEKKNNILYTRIMMLCLEWSLYRGYSIDLTSAYHVRIEKPRYAKDIRGSAYARLTGFLERHAIVEGDDLYFYLHKSVELSFCPGNWEGDYTFELDGANIGDDTYLKVFPTFFTCDTIGQFKAGCYVCILQKGIFHWIEAYATVSQNRPKHIVLQRREKLSDKNYALNVLVQTRVADSNFNFKNSYGPKNCLSVSKNKTVSLSRTEDTKSHLTVGVVKFLDKCQVALDFFNARCHEMLRDFNTEEGAFVISLIRRYRISGRHAYNFIMSRPGFAEFLSHYPMLGAAYIASSKKSQYRDDKSLIQFEKQEKAAFQSLDNAISRNEPITPILRQKEYNKTSINAILKLTPRVILPSVQLLLFPITPILFQRYRDCGIKMDNAAIKHIIRFSEILGSEKLGFSENLEAIRNITPDASWLSLPLDSIKDTVQFLLQIFGFTRFTLMDMGIISPETGVYDIIRLNKLYHEDVYRFDVAKSNLTGDWNTSWEALLEDFECDEGKIVFLNSQALLSKEGREMKHCVGSYGSGASNYCYSIGAVLDTDGQRSTVCFDYQPHAASPFYISQNNGIKNSEPSQKCTTITEKALAYINRDKEASKIKSRIEKLQGNRKAKENHRKTMEDRKSMIHTNQGHLKLFFRNEKGLQLFLRKVEALQESDYFETKESLVDYGGF